MLEGSQHIRIVSRSNIIHDYPALRPDMWKPLFYLTPCLQVFMASVNVDHVGQAGILGGVFYAVSVDNVHPSSPIVPFHILTQRPSVLHRAIVYRGHERIGTGQPGERAVASIGSQFDNV